MRSRAFFSPPIFQGWATWLLPVMGCVFMVYGSPVILPLAWVVRDASVTIEDGMWYQV